MDALEVGRISSKTGGTCLGASTGRWQGHCARRSHPGVIRPSSDCAPTVPDRGQASPVHLAVSATQHRGEVLLVTPFCTR